MATVENVQAIKFCNEQVRPTADLMSQLYWTAKKIVNNWNSQGLSALIPNDGGYTIDDGAAADGRTILTGGSATAIITLVENFITEYEANSNADLNAVSAVAVNTQSKF